MDKKKAIKIATSTAVAAAAFVAVSPAQAASPSEAVDLLEKAENLAGALKWEVSFAGHADGTNQRGKLYADTNLAYEAAQDAVAALSSVRRAELNPRLDQVGVVLDRAMRYYDAVAAGQKLVTITNDLNAALLNDVVTADTVAAYRALMPEFRKAERIMSNVYGKSTRDALRAMYQQDARDALNEAMWPVNVFVEAQRLEAALEVDNEEEATRRVNNLNNWLPNLTQQKFKDQLEPLVAELFEAYDVKYGDEAPIPTGEITNITVDGVDVTFTGTATETDAVVLKLEFEDEVVFEESLELVDGEFELLVSFEDWEVGVYELTATITVDESVLDTKTFTVEVVEAPAGEVVLGKVSEVGQVTDLSFLRVVTVPASILEADVLEVKLVLENGEEVQLTKNNDLYNGEGGYELRTTNATLTTAVLENADVVAVYEVSGEDPKEDPKEDPIKSDWAEVGTVSEVGQVVDLSFLRVVTIPVASLPEGTTETKLVLENDQEVSLTFNKDLFNGEGGFELRTTQASHTTAALKAAKVNAK